MNDDELDRLFRGGATDADRPLADLLTRMRQPSGRDPVPSPWLRATMGGAPMEADAGPYPPLARERHRRPPRLRRLAPLAPALKGVLAGALVAGAAAAFVVAVHAVDGDRRLPVRVISPASSSSPTPVNPNEPAPTTDGPTAAAHPSATDEVRAQPTRTPAPEPSSAPSSTEPSRPESSSPESSSTEPSSPESSSTESSSPESSSTEPSSPESSSPESSSTEPSDPMSQEASEPDSSGE